MKEKQLGLGTGNKKQTFSILSVSFYAIKLIMLPKMNKSGVKRNVHINLQY